MNMQQRVTDPQKTIQSVPYTQAQIRRWLAFLARHLQQHEQTVFLIEQVQLTWLEMRWQRWFYLFSSRSLWMGLLFGLIGGLVFGLIGGLMHWLILGLTGGLVGGMIVGLIDVKRIAWRQVQGQEWSLRPVRSLVIDILIGGLIAGLIVGLIGWQIYGLRIGMLGGIVWGPMFGLIFGFMWNKRSTHRSLDSEIRSIETMAWSWKNVYHRGRQGLMFGLVAGLIVGLVVWWSNIIVLGLFDGPIDGLIVGLILGLVVGLFGGLTTGIREMNTRPNQGVWLTMRYALSVGGIVGLAVGLPVGWFWNTSVGVSRGLICGLLAALWYGGFDVIQHGIIRVLLWMRGDAPLNYARFLDYAATDLHFLQKVGGGYIFVHRYLLEHFAAMDVEDQNATVKE